MIRMKLTALAGFLMFVAAATSTQAATLRAFVSSTGNDANAATNCAQAAPCRTFAAAFPTVSAGGELIALDTAGYGPIANINKAITIAAVPGATAFIVVATGTSGFSINAAAGDVIKLRNLNFNGSGAASTTGIAHNSGRATIENCDFQQLSVGISVVNAKAALRECNLTGNTTAISVTGTGTNLSAPATALLTIYGGSVTFNTIAFSMTDPGAGLFNIYVHAGDSPTDWFTTVAMNTEFLSGSGTGCPCESVGSFRASQNPK
jgi:nitrous oxidase accessory protein NosD